LFHSENAFIELHCILEAKNQLFHLEIAFIKPYCILASTSKKLTVLFRDCISQNQCILAKLKLKLICKEIRIHHKSFSPLLQAGEHVSAGIWLKDYPQGSGFKMICRDHSKIIERF
jgi:hypothetical protein